MNISKTRVFGPNKVQIFDSDGQVYWFRKTASGIETLRGGDAPAAIEQEARDTFDAIQR